MMFAKINHWPTMLYDIFQHVLNFVVGLLTGTCLLRLYLQYQRIPMSQRSGNPMGPFIFAITDWLVLPLRRIVPGIGRWDAASLVAALLLQLFQFGLLWLLAGLHGNPLWVLKNAALNLAGIALMGAMGLLIVYIVLSWVQNDSDVADLFHRMVSPMLRPIRRVIPLVRGVDLSVLVLLLLLQVAMMVLGRL